jgi:hypothetical protein
VSIEEKAVIICFNPFPYYFEYVRQGMVDATVTAS